MLEPCLTCMYNDIVSLVKLVSNLQPPVYYNSLVILKLFFNSNKVCFTRRHGFAYGLQKRGRPFSEGHNWIMITACVFDYVNGIV